MLFCRTEPKDKQRLVKMLQDMGEVRKAPQKNKERMGAGCVA